MNILSIQSHVAYGHVGNTAAAFPLQRLGFEVWRVNTVQFSNHTGYPSWRGEAVTADHLVDVLTGLEELGVLAKCNAVLSGYLGSEAVGQAVLDVVGRVRKANPSALYLCDPVMGDRAQGFYVSPAIADFMASEALPRTDILTPNHFELEHLSGAPVNNVTEALAAARGLLDQGPRVVVVTSLLHSETAADTVEMLAVNKSGAWRVTTPFLACDPLLSGAGDAFAALYLAHFLKTNAGEAQSAQALERATAAVFAMVEATHRAGTRELQIIAAQEDIVKPSRTFTAERLD